MNGASLKDFFDWVVVLNLKRRPDRLQRFNKAMAEIDWPFKTPEVFEATDGSQSTMPSAFKSGAGAWGCLQSHSRIMRETIRRGFNSVLILEDDVCFVRDFTELVARFLALVPPDWDQLMLGGQHTLKFNGPPIEIQHGLLRCRDCERTHCYAVQGRFKQTLLDRWQGGGKYNGMVHCDWIMGRDPEMQLAHKAYAPKEFVAGQELNHSDIVRTVVPRHFWNPPSPDLPVLLLKSPAHVLRDLLPYGIYTGLERDPFTAIDKELARIYHGRSMSEDAHRVRLSKWMDRRQWEVSSDPHLICTIWHPHATESEIRAASTYPVYVLETENVEEALEMMPENLRRSFRPLRDRNVLIHLTTSNPDVLKVTRNHGWHSGFHLDPETQLNVELASLCQNKPESWRWAGGLRRLVASLLTESSTILDGVPVIWHPDIDAQFLRTVTEAMVVEIEADDPREALEKWRACQEELTEGVSPVH